jgi:hypothetical protein
MDITPGMTFHHLTTEWLGPPDKSRTVRWRCRCVCGAERLVQARHLRSGRTKSCGCRGKGGFTRDKTYNAWSAMRQRCCNPNAPSWANYGGRGITIAPEWDDYATFLHDVGAAPTPGHSLDRIDSDGNYEPGNVRWANSQQQARNRRSTRLVTFGGVTQSIAAWAEEKGIPRDTLRSRLQTWSVEKALTTPVHRRNTHRAAQKREAAIAVAKAEVEAARVALAEAEGRLSRLRQ